jgi:FkbH-like protein
MELAEVKTVHPGIECLLFSREPGELLPLLESLRDWFAKDAVSPEDLIRSESIRSAAVWRAAVSGPNAAFEEFLSQTEAHIKLCVGKPRETRRAFELANKTNQFNLNGRRYTEAEWDAYLARSGTFLTTIAYEDKFGPLGVIMAALGEAKGDSVRLGAWVMSCRAFARRIEHQFVRLLFAQCGAAEIVFDYAETARNSPLREFLAAFHQPAAGFRLSKEEFERACPRLFHAVEIVPE